MNKKCFVIQPFDGGKYDDRYRDTYKPAIEAANLDAYRVDHDHTVEYPIKSIEEEIQSAAICLAETTEENPNVWFEVGFARAKGKRIIFVSEEKAKYPFDIQDKHIIQYHSISTKLQEKFRRTTT